MKILVTNDDGYNAKGIRTLVKILRPYGDITVVAPKHHQSGMSMAVNLGQSPIPVKKISEVPGERWWYLGGTPSSCVKYGIDNIFYPEKPDVVVSGINHGGNFGTAYLYSGTIGAAMEGAINGIPAIAVSLDDFRPEADFSAVEAMLPGILEKLLPVFNKRFGSFYNINFPALPESEIKGIRVSRMGIAHWEREYLPYNSEFLASRKHTPSQDDVNYVASKQPDEDLVVMAGDFVGDPDNPQDADHLLLRQGYITITPHNLNNTDTAEIERLCGII